MPFRNQVFKKPEFKKISDVIWEIPKTFKQGMNVPARIYATKKIVDQMDLHVYDQITNVANLPGIQKYVFCMPDGHSGYGFPIGGVAAFDPNEGGVISPGGIGFDINCVAKGTRISLDYGCYKKIEDIEACFSNDRISFMDTDTKQKGNSNAVMFMKKKPDNKIFKITTENGQEITLSEDHPIFTGEKMIKAGELNEGNTVITYPFEGVEYEEPSDEIIIDEIDITNVVGKRTKLIRTLKEKGLLPLRMNSEKLAILAKLLGFLTGDGWLGKYYNKKRKQDVWSVRAIGSLEDLNEIKRDMGILGYNLTHITTKRYESKIMDERGIVRDIIGDSSQFHIVSQSFAVLIKALGMPEGNKTRTSVNVPKWIKKSPLWIKRLYLAGLFGAELTIPYQRKEENFGFTEPSFSQNKIASLENENIRFLNEIRELLKEFGVEVNKLYTQKGVINSYNEVTVKSILRISAKTQNLINLWVRIGYEYCNRRKKVANVAVAYLKKKKRILEDRSYIQSTGDTKLTLKQVRIKPNELLGFKEFLEINSQNSEFITDRIERIEEIPYDDFVYDFTMNHKDHNFIANNLVVSNCGMRLVLTNLTQKDVQPHLKSLVDKLFDKVPAGVGSSGFVKLTKPEFKKVVEQGSEWCVDNDYAWKEDLERTELNGKADWADVSKVSSKAIERGFSQIGTLGSGNHYLEIQVVKEENIFDNALAKKWGLFPNQVVIMFHCGSRGFGHQIGTDYLQLFLSVMEKKYGIEILDPELACAPFNSPEGQDYFKAMAGGVNMSFANRQVILHRIREVFSDVFKQDAEKLGMKMVFDVSHNRASLEEHEVDGEKKKLIVHRKGATGSYPAGREEIPKLYRGDGSPVIIGGSMETGSYLLVGGDNAPETFCSTAHGSGRTMSRTRARGMFRGEELQKNMMKQGIYIKSVSFSGLAEEAGGAYKDVDDVIDATHSAGISKKVVKFIPIGNVKG